MLGEKDWPWTNGRLTAGFLLDLRKDPRVGKVLLFFHASITLRMIPGADSTIMPALALPGAMI